MQRFILRHNIERFRALLMEERNEHDMLFIMAAEMMIGTMFISCPPQLEDYLC
ncbi:hypothetical protein G9X64_20060 [Rhizobium sophorae]|uniref:Uncharacterized protein n=1 Tax=Rhizobium sophorae TaxID=1535242 RepID=A0A7Y3S8T3_9HYPH|nr:hypothetical protein [Rhizobium sophorae]MBX4863177.1 hypothetical protein [Rhizobium bangladeshense]NNU38731.1 hypothetical protein [Rhizobium sophorae]